MKLFLTIIFTILLSFSYAQRADWGYWETMPLKNVQMLTPTMIKEKLSGTTWRFEDSAKWHIKKGVLWESKFVYTTQILGGGIEYIVHIGENEIYQYKYFFFTNDVMNKNVKPFQDNLIFFVGKDDKTLYMCKDDYRSDGEQFYVYKYRPCDRKIVEQLEIYYCIANTHFTILDRVQYPPIKITDIICPAPQSPNERAELPFERIKKTKRNVGRDKKIQRCTLCGCNKRYSKYCVGKNCVTPTCGL